jgi:hypothetical protein
MGFARLAEFLRPLCLAERHGFREPRLHGTRCDQGGKLRKVLRIALHDYVDRPNSSPIGSRFVNRLDSRGEGDRVGARQCFSPDQVYACIASGSPLFETFVFVVNDLIDAQGFRYPISSSPDAVPMTFAPGGWQSASQMSRLLRRRRGSEL